MKLRTTTPASHKKQTMQKIVPVFVAILMVLASFPILNQPASAADEYDNRINALTQDMARYQAEADRLNGEAATLSTALAKLTNEKQALQSQIDLNQTQYDQLVVKISETEVKIKENQDALGTTIADLYVDDEISPIEMLASSQNIGDFLNKQEYRNAVKDQLKVTIKTVKELKIQLGEQKTAVEVVLNQQKSARDSLVAKEAEQQRLLAVTKSNEAEYQRLVQNSSAQIAEAKATQALLRARIQGSSGYRLVDSGSLSDYPWNNRNCAMLGYLSTGGVDGNGGDGYGYGCRQCASYVAWRIAKETGIYYKWGNAKDFTQNAINAGYQYLGQNPQPGSIAIMDPAKAGQSYGHIAWVEAVNGNSVLVSQYNYDYGQGYGMYSKMTLSADAFDHFVKIK